MQQRITLQNKYLRAEIVPQAGGGLLRLDWLGGLHPEPLLRSRVAATDELPLPSELACFPLVPWSNRLAPSGFVFEGLRHVPAPTREGEPCPIHGHGWQQPWRAQDYSPSSALLRHEYTDAAPFSYAAALRYELQEDALVVELTVRNTGSLALPFGLGLHPWMPDPEGARLQAKSTQVWLSGADKLPSMRSALPSNWNFIDPAGLPGNGVDNVFEGWDGKARIDWPARRVGLAVEANMDYFILYAPPGRDFFCFEPVDHPINAHNLPGYPGLSILEPGASLHRRVVFRGYAL